MVASGLYSSKMRMVDLGQFFIPIFVGVLQPCMEISFREASLHSPTRVALLPGTSSLFLWTGRSYIWAPGMVL